MPCVSLLDGVSSDKVGVVGWPNHQRCPTLLHVYITVLKATSTLGKVCCQHCGHGDDEDDGT